MQCVAITLEYASLSLGYLVAWMVGLTHIAGDECKWLSASKEVCYFWMKNSSHEVKASPYAQPPMSSQRLYCTKWIFHVNVVPSCSLTAKIFYLLIIASWISANISVSVMAVVISSSTLQVCCSSPSLVCILQFFQHEMFSVFCFTLLSI